MQKVTRQHGEMQDIKEVHGPTHRGCPLEEDSSLSTKCEAGIWVRRLPVPGGHPGKRDKVITHTFGFVLLKRRGRHELSPLSAPFTTRANRELQRLLGKTKGLERTEDRGWHCGIKH